MPITPLLTDLDLLSVSRLINLPAPSELEEPVRLQDLNSAIEGLSAKDNVKAASAANINIFSPGSSLDGVALLPGDRILLRTQGIPSQNGIYIYNGTSLLTRSDDASTADELESAVVFVDEGTVNGGTSWRQTSVNFVLDSDPVNWIAFGTAAPPASESSPGLIELATAAEAILGTAPNLAITPQTLEAVLASLSSLKLKFEATIGDGTSTLFNLTHAFDTRDLQVTVYRNGTPWDTVICDVQRPDTNTVRVSFSVAPAIDAYRVVILG